MNPTTEQPAVALPAALLLATVAGASLSGGALFAAGSWALGRGEPAAGPAAAAIVAVCTVAGLLAIAPWKRRPMAIWLSMWLGQTVVRFLVTPVLTWLLYSATSLAGLPLAVGITYLLTVVSEAVAVKRCLARAAR